LLPTQWEIKEASIKVLAAFLDFLCPLLRASGEAGVDLGVEAT